MSTHEKLAAAANDRKSRLAQLKSLKRKQSQISDAPSTPNTPSAQLQTETTQALTRTEGGEETTPPSYLSGRNYDPTTRNVKLGFDNLPIADPTKTLEYQAQQLALSTAALQEDEKEEKELDLFKLQPKKPNWDLKRDLESKMRGLGVRTENAIAKLVRERVEAQKVERVRVGRGEGEGEEVGMEGVELVGAMHVKEREEEDERNREKEDDE